jgi:VIT1/CCC1 family predicted Fe2+/Mn2+ transporter
MAAGNFLSIRAHESARALEHLPEEEAHPWRHGGATFVAFVMAGAVPLLPYLVPIVDTERFGWSLLLTMASLFGVGAARAAVTADRWWKSGLEMLALGVVVAAAAYYAGRLVASLV